MLYTSEWKNVFVGGLKSTLSYLTEAIKNLFMFDKNEDRDCKFYIYFQWMMQIHLVENDSLNIW